MPYVFHNLEVQAMRNLLHRMSDWEIAFCLTVNKTSHYHWPRRLFALISRLGDGVFWYCLMLALPFIYGVSAIETSLHMIAVGLLSLPLYNWLKTTTTRERPCAHHDGFLRSVAPLDRYSFPSGHTMHAFGFSFVALSYYPELAWLLIPFTSLVALSRVVLGLHYPSDVLAGAFLGTGIALTTLALY